MVGVFQLLGISFLFWTAVGCIRFIFERIESLRALSGEGSRAALILASLCGAGVSYALFVLILLLLGITTVAEPSVGLAVFALWLGCASLGAYISGRINAHSPKIASALASAANFAVLVLTAGATLGVPALSTANFLSFSIGLLSSLVFGYSAGIVARRFNAYDETRVRALRESAEKSRITKEDIAVVVAAHNEEVSIAATIKSLLKSVRPEQIYIGSDGSKDKTVEIARSYGAHVDDIQPNRGKAGALTYTIETNELLTRYKGILLIDADIEVDEFFIERATKHFDDPSVAAVSGYFVAIWPKHLIPRFELLVTAYRIRLWRILQFFIRYGQTWKHLNVSPIIPGGGSIYRTSVLKHIEINTPGLVIEDFNMTFEVRHKNLGKVAFEPRAYLYDQEPYSIGDFVKQIKRWYLGSFQTMRRHGFWLSWFCFFTYFFTLEMLVSAIIFLLTPFMVLELLLSGRDVLTINFILWGYPITLLNIALAILVIDYIITAGVAIVEKKPLLLVYGILFYPLRFIESAVFLWMLPQAFRAKSTGSWVSPKRVMFDTKK